ncbi:hypothetical protein J4480_04070 [Candidatus Woesearchaeota archaeon]|nr:hypothetical protein [Candidatus Woesearchaeota archaeon]
MRKGQTSIFIIFSLVILIGFGLVFYLNNQNKIKGETGQQINSVNLIIPIKNYVNTCLRETGEDALQIIGLQGGFHKESEHKIFSKGFLTDFFHTIYLFKGENVMPSKQTIEREISQYMDSNLENCIRDFEVFRKLGYEIKKGDVSTITLIAKNSVAINLNFPIMATIEQKTSSIEKFAVEIPSRLDMIYDLANYITQDQITHQDQICISCLIEIGESNNIYFELIPLEINMTLIAIEDSQIKLKNEPYTFVFAFNYSIS